MGEERLSISRFVYEDGAAAEKAFRVMSAAQAQSLSSSKTTDDGTQYSFLPHPSPTSINGSFRIMVADDVLVLRKGPNFLILLTRIVVLWLWSHE
jgi:hypothetical protein